MIEPQQCPSGKVCGAASTEPEDCPAGTQGVIQMMASSSECQPCLPGRFCENDGEQVFSGECSEGYYCVLGSTTATPNGDNPEQGGPCPQGSYCLKVKQSYTLFYLSVRLLCVLLVAVALAALQLSGEGAP